MPQQDRIPAGSHTEDIWGVPVFRWMPRRFASLPEYQPENFGDSLAAALVHRIVSQQPPQHRPNRPARLLSIGSVLHFANSGDVVWGTGINGKIEGRRVGARGLDVRAVRGPKTRDALLTLGVPAPAVFGDPGLLVPEVFPETRRWAQQKRHKLAVVPNFNDARSFASHPNFVNPLAPLWDVVRRIIQSEFVVASSLHGIVIAEAFGIPVRPLSSVAEAPFKYEDYALGTGRDSLPTSETLDDAVRAGPIEPIEWDPQPLLSAFPYDLWRNIRHTHTITADSNADAEQLRRSWFEIREIATPDDEVLIVLDNADSRVIDASMTIAQDDRRVRLRSLGRSGESCENTLLRWARGRSATIRAADDVVISGQFTQHLYEHLQGGRAATLARVIEYGHGPDEDQWRDSLHAPETDIRTYNTLSGLMVSPQKMQDAGYRLEIGPLPLVNWNGSDVSVYDEVVALRKRRPRRKLSAGDMAAQLTPAAEALEATASTGSSLATAVLRYAADLIDPSENYNAADLDTLRRVLIAAGPAVTTISASVVLTSLGLPPMPSLAELTKSVDLLQDTLGPATASCADGLTSAVPLIARTVHADRLAQLRELVRALFSLRSEGQPLSAQSSRLFEAIDLSDEAFALACVDDSAFVLDSVTTNPFGLTIHGSAPKLLAETRLELWSTDVNYGSSRAGSLRCGSSSTDDGRFRGSVRHLFTPGGVLSLRARDSLSMTGLVTTQNAPNGVLQQLLRPVEIPLDGGDALLVRRPSAVSALRARLRQG